MPCIDNAVLTLRLKSSGCAIDNVAAYGIRCATMIDRMSFLSCTLPEGVVVVRAPGGVADER